MELCWITIIKGGEVKGKNNNPISLEGWGGTQNTGKHAYVILERFLILTERFAAVKLLCIMSSVHSVD